MEQVTLRIPATTANLGPGFDSMGCALSLYNTLTFEKLPEGLIITGCPEEYQNEENLAVQSYRAVEKKLGLAPGGLRLHLVTEIPVSRGLGSSAALIIGGVLAANLLHGEPLAREELLAIANEIEGHPDNLAPALYGGLTASLVEDGMPYTVQLPVAESLRFVAAIPNFPLSTHAARSVLPKQVPYADAVYNASHAAVLLGALQKGDAALIRAAMQDRLHQPYRKALIHEYDAVQTTAEECGALGFCISGAGPTLLCLTDDAAFADRLAERCATLEYGWRILDLPVDRKGAVALPEGKELR